MPIIKLHRGSESTMSTSPKKNIVLENGELFIEIPDTIDSDNQYKFKVGDGSTTYENLPYAIDPTNISSNNSSGNNDTIEDYISKDNITLSGSNTTTVTFIDDSIKSNSTIDLLCNIENIYYSSVSISNGTCTFVFPIQESNIVVSFRLYVDKEYYRDKKVVSYGNATTADVLSGYTFSSASGIGLTGNASISPFYRQIGDTVTCTLSGSNSNSSYSCDVVYTGPKTYGDPTSGYKMCLLGNSYVASAQWTVACNYTWTATFAAGQVSDTSKTISNVKIPTVEEIRLYCVGREKQSGRFYSSSYWTSTFDPNKSSSSSYAWRVDNQGEILSVIETFTNGIIPYITILL